MTNDQTILVTRFNLQDPRWNSASEAEYRDWLDHRIGMFAEYTVRSLRNCREKPDQWLILVSDADRFDLYARLEPLLEGLSFRIHDSRDVSLRNAIVDALDPSLFPMRLRMTRLDSDDLVHRSFFARLGRVEVDDHEAERGLVVSFPGGCNYEVATGAYFYSAYPDNPFLTLIEDVGKPSDVRTVFFRQHHQLMQSGPAVRMERTQWPMWASVIHPENTENQRLSKMNKFELGPAKRLDRMFGIDADG